MKLNEEKLTAMVEAVMNDVYIHIDSDNTHQKLVKQDIRTALTPFAMEMTDEEIEEEANKIKIGLSVSGLYEITDIASTEIARRFFIKGFKKVRDGKTTN